MRKSLTITGFERPELFDAVIRDIAACNPDGWHLYAGIEPGPQAAQFDKICAAHLPGGSYSLTINDRRLGVTENPLQVQERAYGFGSDFNLHLEEDLRIAPDALQMADWYWHNRRKNWVALSLLSGCCGTEGYLSRPDYADTLTETRLFNSLGFAIDRDMWATVVHPVWSAHRQHRWLAARYLGVPGWDWQVSGSIYANSALRVVQPLTARATHFGPNGTHCTREFQSRAFDGLFLADTLPETYALTDRSLLPHDVRSHLNLLEEVTKLRAETQRRSPGQIERQIKRWLAIQLGLKRPKGENRQ